MARLRQLRRLDFEEDAFTRVELTVVIATVAVLGLLVMPSLASSKTEAKGTICISNKQQLMRGWQLYTVDNSGAMPGVTHGGEAQAPNSANAWCAGWLDWSAANPSTNVAYLIDPRYSQLTRYISSNRFLYQCPADKYLSPVQKRFNLRERVRSISANVYVGEGNAEAGPIDQKYFHAKRIGDLVKPSPANVYMYLDEHPDSINDPAFFSPFGSPPSAFQMIDFASGLHEGAAAISFTDGHADLHRWKNLQLMPVKLGPLAPPPNTKLQEDALYLYERTPRK